MTVESTTRAYGGTRMTAWQVVPVAWSVAQAQYLRGVARDAREFLDGDGLGPGIDISPHTLHRAGVESTVGRVVMNVGTVEVEGVAAPGAVVAERARVVWEAFRADVRGRTGRVPEDGWRETRAVWDVRERWAWTGGPPGVVEDRPWEAELRTHGPMRQIPMWWVDLVAPNWREPDYPKGRDRVWRLGDEAPPWARDVRQRSRVAVRTRELLRSWVPLACDLDQVEGVLPTSPGWAWFVQAGRGWCFCWEV